MMVATHNSWHRPTVERIAADVRSRTRSGPVGRAALALDLRNGPARGP